MKKILIVILMICVLLLAGCAEKEPKMPTDKCGDGQCDPVELENQVCPEDCGLPPEPEPEEPREPGVVYVALMIHLEGHDGAPYNEEAFGMWADTIREHADLLEEYDAKGTFEARPHFVEASENFGDNVLAELYDRGHGIGIHADIGGGGYFQTGYTQADMTADLVEMKTNIESLLGHEVRHASGICSNIDWVQAAIDAGLEFTTGGVAMCGFSLAEENIPTGITRSWLMQHFHSIFPTEIEDRMHPWRISDGSNWLEHDPNGELVFFASDGVIEGLEELEGGSTEHKWEDFDQEDIDIYIEKLEETIALSDKNKINYLYVALSIGSGMDSEVAEDWLQAIQPYVESGEVEWRTIPQMYDEYIEMEG